MERGLRECLFENSVNVMKGNEKKPIIYGWISN